MTCSFQDVFTCHCNHKFRIGITSSLYLLSSPPPLPVFLDYVQSGWFPVDTYTSWLHFMSQPSYSHDLLLDSVMVSWVYGAVDGAGLLVTVSELWTGVCLSGDDMVKYFIPVLTTIVSVSTPSPPTLSSFPLYFPICIPTCLSVYFVIINFCPRPHSLVFALHIIFLCLYAVFLLRKGYCNKNIWSTEWQ